MNGLIRDMPAGLSGDCLLARIKGRRSFLVRDWERLLLARSPLATLTAAPWRPIETDVENRSQQGVQQEYFWVYSRMDTEQRHALSPFFWLTEVRTLSLSLRLISSGGMELTSLLQASLLAQPIQNALRKSGSSTEGIVAVTKILASYDPRFAELIDRYRTGGFGALETALYELSLQHLTGRTLHPQLRIYLTLMIDSRNLTTIAKGLRWRQETLPPLLVGGALALSPLGALFAHRDRPLLLYLAMRLGGQAAYSENDDLERVLYEAQCRVLRRLSREEEGIGSILYYLWRCHNEAINIALLTQLKLAGSAAVSAELRQ